MAKPVVHAAKIPEAIQARPLEQRLQAGDMVYVNACDDRPWVKVSPLMSRSQVVLCQLCARIVEVNRDIRRTNSGGCG